VLLSEQQLVDCCGALGYQCQGCRGAWPEWSFKFVQDKGLVSTSEYPYTARDGQCKIQSGPNKISGFKQLANSPAALQAGLVQGPVSVCVDASNWSMYRSGVFSNCRSALNHAVLAVGYDDSQWHIKNSWGSWGESGYIRLAPGNTCGVTSHAIIPTA
jgi:cathepsin L